MEYPEPRDGLGIARRALTNLDLVKQCKLQHPDESHLVTQVVLTCLAVVVFPWEQWYDEDSELIALAAGSTGWKVDDRTGSKGSDNLRYLRHALAHGGIRILSRSPDPAEVTIYFESRPADGGDVNWEAEIQADLLDAYLRRLFVQMEDRFD